MPLPPLYGHEALRARLAGAESRGQLPQVLLLEGPRGVGKQRLALWLAQRLVCAGTAGKAAVEPCGECQPCRMVLGLAHPDVHWFIPLELSKKGADADKLVEIVEAALGEELAARREQPLYDAPGGMASHSIAAVRLILRRLAMTPAMASRKVFIIGDAERLVPQVSTPDAANALLKALEEPPANTVFILTATDAGALLPTIQSRVVRIRVPRLPDGVVTAFAQSVLGRSVSTGSIAAAAGCIGALVSQQAAGEAIAKAEDAASRFLEAMEGTPVDRLLLALRQMPFQARGGFTDMLDALLRRLQAEARTGKDSARVVAAIAKLLEARELARGNVNPQLLTAVLGEDLAPGAKGSR